MKLYASLVLILCSATVAAQSQTAGSAKPLSAFEQEIMNAEKGLMNAFERGDLEYLWNGIADVYVAIGSSGDADHKGGILAWLRVNESRSESGKKPEKPIF